MHWKVPWRLQVQLLFLSRKGCVFVSKRAFPYIQRVWSTKFSRGLCAPTLLILFSFISYDPSTLAMTGGYRALPLVNYVVSLQAPNPFCPLPLATHFPPKDVTLAKPPHEFEIRSPRAEQPEHLALVKCVTVVPLPSLV